jgi:hypothetical protein
VALAAYDATGEVGKLSEPGQASLSSSDSTNALARGLSADRSRVANAPVFWGDGLFDLPTTLDPEVAHFRHAVAQLRAQTTADSPLNLGYLPAALATVSLPARPCSARPFFFVLFFFDLVLRQLWPTHW